MRDHRPYEYAEPSPRGGWFEPDETRGRRLVEQTFRGVGAVLGAGFAFWFFIVTSESRGPLERAPQVLLAVAAVAMGAFVCAMAYGAGAAVTAVSWRALSHDLRLRSVWAILLEMALFSAAIVMLAYSAIDAVNHRSAYSACVLVLIAGMSFWPLIRRRIRYGR